MNQINRKTFNAFFAGFVVYFVFALSSVFLTRISQNVVVFWPANAIIVLMILVQGRERFLPLVLAAYCANEVTQVIFGDPALMVFGFPLANCLEISIVYFGLRFAGFEQQSIESPKTAMILLGLVSLGAIPAAAIGSSIVSILYGGTPFAAFVNWWAGDIVSAMIIYLPFLSLGLDQRGIFKLPSIRSVQVQEWGATLLSFLFGFFVLLALHLPPAIVLVFPTLWLALKGRVFDVALLSSVLTIITSAAVVFGMWPGLDSNMNLRDAVFQQQTLALFCTFPSYIIAVSIANFADSQRRLTQQHEALTITLAHMRQGVSVFDKDCRLTVWNEQYSQLFGINPVDLVEGIPFQELIEKQEQNASFVQDPRQYEINILAHVNLGKEHYVETKLSSGRYIRSVHSPTPVGGWVGTHEDITEKRMLEDKLAYDSLHDVLTDVPNRRYFEKELADRLRVAQGEKSAIALFSIDLDNFKKINDTYGHEVGDEILNWAASHIGSVKRKGDFLARIGGDEFMLLVTGAITADSVKDLAERVNKSLLGAIETRGVTCACNASIGIAYASDGQVSDRELLSQADVALYAAKKNGRGTHQIYDFSLDRRQGAQIAS